jgi:RNA polymerase sigma factor for flagellar operon FliA
MADLNDPKNQSKLNHFIAEYAPLIKMHIKKLRDANKIPSHTEDEDLIFHGVHGLMDALHKYDPTRGVKFQTYLGHRVQGKMLDHVASENAIPKHIREQAKQFKVNKPE